MREILFRGKRSDNGEWVEGYLLFDEEHNEAYIAEHFEDRAAYLRKVIPETVGQFTGLTDKNGKKMFEGDIVREQILDHLKGKHYEVSMDSDRCGWFPLACGDGCGCCETDTISCGFAVVIGNIHDNPELLKGGEAE